MHRICKVYIAHRITRSCNLSYTKTRPEKSNEVNGKYCENLLGCAVNVFRWAHFQMVWLEGHVEPDPNQRDYGFFLMKLSFCIHYLHYTKGCCVRKSFIHNYTIEVENHYYSEQKTGWPLVTNVVAVECSARDWYSLMAVTVLLTYWQLLGLLTFQLWWNKVSGCGSLPV